MAEIEADRQTSQFFAATNENQLTALLTDQIARYLRDPCLWLWHTFLLRGATYWLLIEAGVLKANVYRSRRNQDLKATYGTPPEAGTGALQGMNPTEQAKTIAILRKAGIHPACEENGLLFFHTGDIERLTPLKLRGDGGQSDYDFASNFERTNGRLSEYLHSHHLFNIDGPKLTGGAVLIGRFGIEKPEVAALILETPATAGLLAELSAKPNFGNTDREIISNLFRRMQQHLAERDWLTGLSRLRDAIAPQLKRMRELAELG